MAKNRALGFSVLVVENKQVIDLVNKLLKRSVLRRRELGVRAGEYVRNPMSEVPKLELLCLERVDKPIDSFRVKAPGRWLSGGVHGAPEQIAPVYSMHPAGIRTAGHLRQIESILKTK